VEIPGEHFCGIEYPPNLQTRRKGFHRSQGRCPYWYIYISLSTSLTLSYLFAKSRSLVQSEDKKDLQFLRMMTELGLPPKVNKLDRTIELPSPVDMRLSGTLTRYYPKIKFVPTLKLKTNTWN